MSVKFARLHVVCFGLAIGITWGITTFLLGVMANLFGWGNNLVGILSSLYMGYEPTLFGSLVGLVWGLLDGFVGGVIIAWLYNKITEHCIMRRNKNETK